MEVAKYLQKMKVIYSSFLEFIEDENDNEEKYEILIISLDSFKIQDNKHDLTSFIHIIARISYNHYHNADFLNKIFRLIRYLKDSIIKHFSNNEIFNLFSKNKRIILFLIEEKMMIIDQSIAYKIMSPYNTFVRKKYPEYFYPELKPFISKEEIENIKKNLGDSFENDIFEEKRKIGQNDSYLCEIIREDNIKEFAIYVNKYGFKKLSDKTNYSIFETNPYLLKYDTNLIQYVVFFGAIQILRFMYTNNLNLNYTVWLCAIHSNNPEIIHFLEEKHIEPYQNQYDQLLFTSINCHHNEIADYFINNHFDDKNKTIKSCLSESLKSHNFAFIEPKLIDHSSFFNLCKGDYFDLVKILINSNSINVNEINISIYFIYVVFN